ncbi:hypothetical protein P7K49_031885 [Saguinus oedipus]|uniref:SET domain-containing protein n=1 Tax=Saguinus oedipus TaxID=9490 RepID=A0ABQ9U0N7_SAGOE|nr:hypothetical protein P7K49_031885 [Saguinus oedipus]
MAEQILFKETVHEIETRRLSLELRKGTIPLSLWTVSCRGTVSRGAPRPPVFPPRPQSRGALLLIYVAKPGDFLVPPVKRCGLDTSPGWVVRPSKVRLPKSEFLALATRLWSRSRPSSTLPSNSFAVQHRVLLREKILDEFCNVKFCIDASQPDVGSWLKYIRFAGCYDQHNLVACQINDQIFYRVVADIAPGEELLLFMKSEDYPHETMAPDIHERAVFKTSVIVSV